MSKKTQSFQRCATKFCRGLAQPKRHHSPYCAKCRSRRFKAAHPLKYSFFKLKGRAKERGKAFQLTFAEYEQFAKQTGYDKQRGKTKYSLTIHRINNDGPYSRNNIAAVTLSLNARLNYAPLPAYLKEEMLAALRASKPPRISEAAT